MARGKKAEPAAGLPSREDILAFVAGQTGKVGKREIARAFGLKGADRIALKRVLADMAEEGLIEKRQKRLSRPGALPPVAVLVVAGHDADGEIFAEPAEWDADEARPPRILLRTPARKGRARDAAPVPGMGDRVLARIAQADPAEGYAYTARVMKRLDKARGRELGVFRAEEGGGGRIEPIDKKALREYRVPESGRGEAGDGELVAVETSRGGRMGPPMARVVERLGRLDGEHAISQIAIHSHVIPHVFPQAALSEAGAARHALLEGREDWRDVALITIDPPDAKDHDDAVHAEPDPDPANSGGVVVTVAIADVSWYVRPGSAMDAAARERGNSVYFPDRVVPMLPERISTDLCSLKPGEDRPALAVRMVFSAAGRKLRHSFHRVMMRSAANLAYEAAQEAIEGRPDEATKPLLEPVLRPLWEAFAVLDRGRAERSPLALDLPERKIVLKQDGTVERVVVPERRDAHRLIEEFMIQANVAAAETLEKRGAPVVYRVHDAPSPAKLEALREFLTSIDVKLPKAGNLRPAHFNAILEKVADEPVEELAHQVVLRSQAQAAYALDNLGHFGLHLRRYAHFTSPIRRYADLLVHRALVRGLGLGEGGMVPAEEERLAEIAAEISMAERRAMTAERDTVDRLIAHYLADRIGARFSGRISGVTRAGLFIKLDETGADGFVPISKLGEEYFAHDEAGQSLVGTRTGEAHRLGDRVEVRLVEAAPLAGALRFELLSEGRYLKARDPARKRAERRGGPGRGAREGRGKGRTRSR